MKVGPKYTALEPSVTVYYFQLELLEINYIYLETDILRHENSICKLKFLNFRRQLIHELFIIYWISNKKIKNLRRGNSNIN